MTTYGTIPTSPEVPTLDFISSAKTALATRRPWKEMIHLHSFTIPRRVPEAILRIRTNSAYFRVNYAIIVLLLVFLSLLWLPISLIVFLIMMAAWLFLYFLRDDPLVVFQLIVDDRIVLAVLSIVTLAALLLTHATLNILVSLLIGLAIVALHAAFRKTDDLFVEDEEAVSGLYTSEEGGQGSLNEPSTSS